MPFSTVSGHDPYPSYLGVGLLPFKTDIIVETVGVGQSEVMVSEMTDIFLLLMAPGGGDELQGVKRGIMEIADLILVNKADGELKSTALRTCADYAGALRLLRKRQIDPDDFPKALTLSSLEATGLDKVWREINLLKDYRAKTGIWIDQRRNQSLDWFESELKKRMIQKFEKDSKFLELKSVFKKEVWDEKITPERAAEDILKTVEKNK